MVDGTSVVDVDDIAAFVELAVVVLPVVVVVVVLVPESEYSIARKTDVLYI